MNTNSIEKVPYFSHTQQLSLYFTPKPLDNKKIHGERIAAFCKRPPFFVVFRDLEEFLFKENIIAGRFRLLDPENRRKYKVVDFSDKTAPHIFLQILGIKSDDHGNMENYTWKVESIF